MGGMVEVVSWIPPNVKGLDRRSSVDVEAGSPHVHEELVVGELELPELRSATTLRTNEGVDSDCDLTGEAGVLVARHSGLPVV